MENIPENDMKAQLKQLSSYDMIKTLTPNYRCNLSVSNIAIESPAKLTDSDLEGIVDVWKGKSSS